MKNCTIFSREISNLLINIFVSIHRAGKTLERLIYSEHRICIGIFCRWCFVRASRRCHILIPPLKGHFFATPRYSTEFSVSTAIIQMALLFSLRLPGPSAALGGEMSQTVRTAVEPVECPWTHLPPALFALHSSWCCQGCSAIGLRFASNFFSFFFCFFSKLPIFP